MALLSACRWLTSVVDAIGYAATAFAAVIGSAVMIREPRMTHVRESWGRTLWR